MAPPEVPIKNVYATPISLLYICDTRITTINKMIVITFPITLWKFFSLARNDDINIVKIVLGMMAKQIIGINNTVAVNWGRKIGNTTGNTNAPINAKIN